MQDASTDRATAAQPLGIHSRAIACAWTTCHYGSIPTTHNSAWQHATVHMTKRQQLGVFATGDWRIPGMDT